MLFSSITFLYYFLPIVLLLHTISPKPLKNTVLLISSLIFYAWGEPRLAVLLVISLIFHFICGLLIEKYKEKNKTIAKTVLWISALVSLGMIGYFKYTNFFIDTVNSALGTVIPLLKVSLPIGISFYTFQLVSYQIDVYRGMKAENNIIDFCTFISFFPQLIAGPIVRYVDISKELKERKVTLARFSLGIRRFVFGLAKKILIANTLGELTEIFRASGDLSVLYFWMYAIAFTLYIYYDFSGYSDMAIGLSKMFGFEFPENFNYPYISKTVTEFWRRWHISLGSWFRDYVYFPMGGSRVNWKRHIINIGVVWALTGLWHGASWNFVLWGLYYGVFLIIEKFFLMDFLKKHKIFSHVYTMLATIIGFTIFNATTFPQIAHDLGGLIGLGGHPLVSAEALYYLKSFAVPFIVGAFFATPIAKNAVMKLNENKTANTVLTVVEPIVIVAIVLFVTGSLVDGSFNPFLYFRF